MYGGGADPEKEAPTDTVPTGRETPTDETVPEVPETPAEPTEEVPEELPA
jgi:hypothetical protein